MQKLFKNNIVAVFLSLVASSLVMMVCEYTNSLIYPFPAGMDTKNIEEVRAFTENMPSTAYILVLLGWTLGSALGAYLLQRYSRVESRTRNIKILIMVLTLLGLANNLMFGVSTVIVLLGLIVFYAGAMAGVRLAKKNN